MRHSSLNSFPIKVPANQSHPYVLTASGLYLFVRHASAPFRFSFDDAEENDGLPLLEVPYSDGFQTVNIFNRTTRGGTPSTADLFVHLLIARDPGVRQVALYEAPSNLDGQANLAIADGDSVDMPGVNSIGQRREYAVVTMRPALAGRLEVYNKASGRLVSIVGAGSSGGGHAIRSGSTLTLKNQTGGAIQNYGATPDFSWADAWLL